VIANARMYSVSPEAAERWRRLLVALIERSAVSMEILDHPPPAPIEALWARRDLGAVFMCGLPYSQTQPTPHMIAAPVPSGADFGDRPEYWSELVVRRDCAFETLEDALGGRIAYTTSGSQSGCVAALEFFQANAAHSPRFSRFPLFAELIGPCMTPVGAAVAVAGGAADLAPIDSYAYALMQVYRPELTDQLRVIARTAKTPIPPLVATHAPSRKLTEAFLAAHRVPECQPLLAALRLSRFEAPDPEAYRSLREGYESTTRFWREHRLAAKIDPAFAVYSAL
jgi:ABC-type phosphate/phosphonate transport system substrate-binding protein